MLFSYSVCGKCQRVNKFSIKNSLQQKPVCGACKSELNFHDGVTELNSHQLQTLIQKSPLPVVVDFWAPWCGPCRTFAPTYASTAEELAGRFVFAKVNTEADPSAGAQFGIRGIPTVALFQSGRELKRQSGALPKDHFVHWLTT